MSLALTTVAPSRDSTALAKRGGIGLVLALVVNAVVLGGVNATDAVESAEELAFGPVLMLTAIGVIGAVITYAAIDRLSETPDRTFAIVATVVLVLSFVPNVLGYQGGDLALGVALSLMAMHVPPAAASVGTLTEYVW